MTFEYTYGDSDVDSSAVYEAYYNEHNRELAVVLSGGNAYVYKNVPKHVYNELVNSGSPGRYYASVVKPKYGQATLLGYVGFDSNEFEQVSGVPAPSMAAVTNVNTFTTVGTPKALTYASDATVDGHRVTLAPVEPVAAKRNILGKFDVEFVVNERVRNYEVDAESFDGAANAVLEIGNMLDLEFTVKGVRVVE